MINDVERLTNLLNTTLFANSPILSGNMKRHIRIQDVGKNYQKIVIGGKFYNVNEFNKTGKIKFTNKKINGITNYPMFLNEVGAFGRKNKSMHWVNRVCNEVANIIAQEIGNCEVINKLPLD